MTTDNMTETQKQMLASCKRIAAEIAGDDTEWHADARTNNDYDDDMTPNAADYIMDAALDIEYRVTREHEYKSAEIVVAFGGPSIYIDTKTRTVEGRWWNESCSVPYTDEIGIDDAAEELFGL